MPELIFAVLLYVYIPRDFFFSDQPPCTIVATFCKYILIVGFIDDDNLNRIFQIISENNCCECTFAAWIKPLR